MYPDAQTLISLLIVGLGTARITALVTLDDITESLRDLIFHYFPPHDSDANGWFYQSYRKATPQERAKLAKLGRNFYQRRFEFDGTTTRKPTFIGRLVACHKCVGVWVAAANTGAYLLWPQPVLAINFALAAAFVSIITIGRNWR